MANIAGPRALMAQRADASREALGRITVEGLRGEREDEPPMYFGNALDAVLGLSAEERARVRDAFAALVFWSPVEKREERDGRLVEAHA